jgi:sec-independent protein translocase protein TatA
MFGLSVQELIIVGVIAILLFGKRLPEVAKSLGQQYREFRKGLMDIQSSFNSHDTYTYSSSSSSTSSSYDEYTDYDAPTAPKLELPATESPPATGSQPSDSAPMTTEGAGAAEVGQQQDGLSHHAESDGYLTSP